MAETVFISFNKADRRWATWIAWLLEAGGHKVTFQDWDFAPGQNFVLRMHEELQRADKVLLVLSPTFLASQYAAAEWSSAFTRDPTGRLRHLLPVRVEPCNPEGLLGPLIYVDLVGLTETDAQEKLLAGLSVESRRPQEPPDFPSIH
jgi:hypothetical protein